MKMRLSPWGNWVSAVFRHKFSLEGKIKHSWLNPWPPPPRYNWNTGAAPRQRPLLGDLRVVRHPALRAALSQPGGRLHPQLQEGGVQTRKDWGGEERDSASRQFPAKNSLVSFQSSARDCFFTATRITYVHIKCLGRSSSMWITFTQSSLAVRLRTELQRKEVKAL